MDCGMLDGKPFFCTAGVGLDADVAWRFASSTGRGLRNYIRIAIRLWRHFHPQTYTVNVDGNVITTPAVFITVGNANQWGNEARIVPNASLRDGLLDVTVVLPFATYEIPELAARLMLGKAETSRRVRTFRGKTVRIHRDHPGPAHCDGDPFEAGVDLQMEIKPGALRVVVPRSRLEKI